jgi:hypothetical protein
MDERLLNMQLKSMLNLFAKNYKVQGTGNAFTLLEESTPSVLLALFRPKSKDFRRLGYVYLDSECLCR